MNPRARQLQARDSVSSYLEPTAKHLIIVASSAVINAFCPAGVKTTAARAAHWLAAREHIIWGGGEAEAESQIITLASFSVIASSERGAHQQLLPLRRRLGNAANREHMLAGGGRRRTNTAPYTRRAEADGGHATSPAASSAATRAENRGGDDLFGI